jgi:HEAT repeat protein
MTPRARACGAGIAALLTVRAATADGGARDAEEPRSAPDHSLRARFGVDEAEILLASENVGDRLRGLERLGAVGTPRAVYRLLRALQPGGSAATPEERLVAVRVLAVRTDDASVRRALVRVLGGHAVPAAVEKPGPLDDLAQDTAALALARSGTPDAVSALGKALGGTGRAAASARAALVAYPPRDIAALLGATSGRTAALAQTLSELGDQRAFGALRSLVQGGSPEVRAIAAVGLTELGDFETVELAARWTTNTEPAPLRIAGTRILALSHSPLTSGAISRLLDDDATFQDGLALALESPSIGLFAPLVKRLTTADDANAARIIAALGRAGGREAVATLAGELAKPRRAAVAAHALARMDDEEAGATLERALLRPETKRLAARALALRAFVRGEVPRGLSDALGALARSPAAADRAAGVTGLAVLDPDRIGELLSNATDGDVRSIAGVLPLGPEESFAIAAARLCRTQAGPTRTALALALSSEDAERRVPTRLLLDLVDEGGPAAPLAVRALAARDEPEHRTYVLSLLASGDPWIRSHAALGLGRSERADAEGLLAGAYRFETDPRVRGAIVRALSRRHATQNPTLSLAAAFDPDPGVRGAARLAAAGARLPEARTGTAAVFVPVSASDAGSPPPATALAVATPGGLVVPAVADADGVALVLGLPPGPVELRVAPGPAPIKDSERDFRGNQETEPERR